MDNYCKNVFNSALQSKANFNRIFVTKKQYIMYILIHLFTYITCIVYFPSTFITLKISFAYYVSSHYRFRLNYN